MNEVYLYMYLQCNNNHENNHIYLNIPEVTCRITKLSLIIEHTEKSPFFPLCQPLLFQLKILTWAMVTFFTWLSYATHDEVKPIHLVFILFLYWFCHIKKIFSKMKHNKNELLMIKNG